MNSDVIRALERRARALRRHILVLASTQYAHLGGAMSCADLMIGFGRLARVGVRDVFCTEVAPYPELLRLHGIDAMGIEAAARSLLRA